MPTAVLQSLLPAATARKSTVPGVTKITLLITGNVRPAATSLAARIGEPQSVSLDCFIHTSIGGVSGERLPKRTQALSCGGPASARPPPEPLPHAESPAASAITVKTRNNIACRLPGDAPERAMGGHAPALPKGRPLACCSL